MFLAIVLQSTAIERRFAPNVRPSAAYYLAVVYNTEWGGHYYIPFVVSTGPINSSFVRWSAFLYLRTTPQSTYSTKYIYYIYSYVYEYTF